MTKIFNFMKLIFGLSLSVLIFGQADVQSQVPNDFDVDGVSDKTFISGTNERVWKSLLSSDSTTVVETPWGVVPDVPILGNWLASTTTHLGLVQSNPETGVLVWKILDGDTIKSAECGRTGDTILTGGDFDGNGISDAVAVRTRRSGIHWTVKYNIFTEEVVEQKFRFGKSGDRVFYLNLEGQNDWIGVIGRKGRSKARVLLRNLQNRKSRNFKRMPPKLVRSKRPRPYPLAQADGRDLLVFATDVIADTLVQVYQLNGTLVNEETFPGKGSMAIGEYDASQPGEEIVFNASSKLYVYSPISGSYTTTAPVQGQLVDAVTVSAVPIVGDDSTEPWF